MQRKMCADPGNCRQPDRCRRSNSVGRSDSTVKRQTPERQRYPNQPEVVSVIFLSVAILFFDLHKSCSVHNLFIPMLMDRVHNRLVNKRRPF